MPVPMIAGPGRPTLAARLAGPATFVLLQLQPTVRVLAVADQPEPLDREIQTLMALHDESGDRRRFEWTVQAAPKVAG